MRRMHSLGLLLEIVCRTAEVHVACRSSTICAHGLAQGQSSQDKQVGKTAVVS